MLNLLCLTQFGTFARNKSSENLSFLRLDLLRFVTRNQVSLFAARNYFPFPIMLKFVKNALYG